MATNFPNGVLSYGMPVLPYGIPPGGNVYFLDPAHGSDSNDGLSIDQAFASLEEAEDHLTANQNDVLFYIAGSSSTTLTAALTWDKSYTHLIGLCAPTHAAQRCRVFQLSTLTDASPLVTISATGCIFSNLYIFQGVADAGSLINVSVTGGRNYFHNVHFAGGGDATQAVDGGASLLLNGAEENTFVNCTVGVDTAEATDGYSALLFDGSAHRNAFVDCLIQAYPAAAQTGVALVELADTAACDRWTDFRGCRFFSNSTNKAVTLASAFVIPAGHTTTATIFLDNATRGLGFTDWDADNRGILYLDSEVHTGGGNSGFSLVSNAT